MVCLVGDPVRLDVTYIYGATAHSLWRTIGFDRRAYVLHEGYGHVLIRGCGTGCGRLAVASAKVGMAARGAAVRAHVHRAYSPNAAIHCTYFAEVPSADH